MSFRLLVAAVALAAWTGCTEDRSGTTGSADAASARGERSDVAVDGGFVCTPPDGSTQPPVTFSGTQFDVAKGCLISGSAVPLPICGCFHDTGKDSSTWCFSAPDGTSYFAGSNDGCSVDMPAGWYAVQTFGPSPFGTPTATQADACERLAGSSTSVTTGTYDRPGPPLCPTDGGATLKSDAATCVYPPGADTYGDASGGCRPQPAGNRCGGFASEHFLLGCTSGPSDAGAPVPMPDMSLGCSAVPILVPSEQYWCCPCGS